MDDLNSNKKSRLIKELLWLKVKFASGSVIATLVDWTIYMFLADVYFTKVVANLISRFVGMLINFWVQKTFVFELKRKAVNAFMLTVVVSIIGLGVGTIVMKLIGDWEIWGTSKYYKIFPKVIETGVVFFYNFYFKRYVFEKRFI